MSETSPYILTHGANTEWWGAPAGLVNSPGFFELAYSEQKALCEPFSFIEFKASINEVDALKVAACGFRMVDIQITFDLKLADFRAPEYSPAHRITSAADRPFLLTYGNTREFKSERFTMLPGASQDLVDRRYVTWANQLITKNPAYALELEVEGKAAGWFFGTPQERGVELTLAALQKEAKVPGRILYGLACEYFSKLGQRHSFASFSAQNIPVLRILAGFGARFTSSVTCWLWVNPDPARAGHGSARL